MPDLRIVFMGTPDFAVASLDILVQHGYDVVGVITAPDRPAGRGRKLRPSAVKEYALKHGLRILQPTNLKNAAFLEELRALKADLQIVVAFRMLPEAVWSMPPEGTVNLHASLLPQYRGAAPINHVLINGERETGVTTFFIRQEIDTGDLLLQERVPIGGEETAGELHNRLMSAGAELVLRTVRAIEADSLTPIPQAFEGTLKNAPKIYREDAQIDVHQSAREIFNRIRGLSPYPAAFTELHGKTLKIYNAHLHIGTHGETPGSITTSDGVMRLYAHDGWLDLTEVQLEGKKRMSAGDFLRGYIRPD